MFLDETLKIILLVDERGKRGDSVNQHYIKFVLSSFNDVYLNIPTYENVIWFIRKLSIFFFILITCIIFKKL